MLMRHGSEWSGSRSRAERHRERGSASWRASRSSGAHGRRRPARRGAAMRGILLDGEHLVQEAILCDIPIEIAAFADKQLSPTSSRRRPAREGHQRSAAAACMQSSATQVLAAMSPVQQPSGVVAIARSPPRRVVRVVLATVTDLAAGVGRGQRAGPGQRRRAAAVGGGRRRIGRVRHRRVGQSVLVEGAPRQHGQRAAPADRHRPASGRHHGGDAPGGHAHGGIGGPRRVYPIPRERTAGAEGSVDRQRGRRPPGPASWNGATSASRFRWRRRWNRSTPRWRARCSSTRRDGRGRTRQDA